MTKMKDIPDYEGHYSIDELGNVWSHKRQKYMTQYINDNGYYAVRLNKLPDMIRKEKTIHRLLGLLYIDNPDNKPDIDHINRIRTDNRLENLRWATHQENMNNKSLYQNNRLNLQYIHQRENNTFRFKIERKGLQHSKTFDTLEETVIYRNNFLANNIP